MVLIDENKNSLCLWKEKSKSWPGQKSGHVWKWHWWWCWCSVFVDMQMELSFCDKEQLMHLSRWFNQVCEQNFINAFRLIFKLQSIESNFCIV